MSVQVLNVSCQVAYFTVHICSGIRSDTAISGLEVLAISLGDLYNYK